MITLPRVLAAAIAVALLTGCAEDGNDTVVGGWTSFPTPTPDLDTGVRGDAESATSGVTTGADAESTIAGDAAGADTESTAAGDAAGADVGSTAAGDAATTDVGTTTPAAAGPDVEPTGVVIPVTALDNSFRPEIVEIAVGDEVVWENRGMNEHDVLYVAGDDWGVEVDRFQPGVVYSHVFTEPGEYRYYCSIHGNTEVGMVGTVIVAE